MVPWQRTNFQFYLFSIRKHEPNNGHLFSGIGEHREGGYGFDGVRDLCHQEDYHSTSPTRPQPSEMRETFFFLGK